MQAIAALPPPTQWPSLYYRSTVFLTHLLARLLMRTEIIGLENIPKTGPVLLAPTHTSYLDPMLIGSHIGRPMCFLARETLLTLPIMGTLIRNLNTWPIRRGASDREAIRLCRTVLKAGYPLVFFPEGTRSRDGKMGPIQGGFAMVLDGMDVPYCPIVMQDTFRALPRGACMLRPVKVRMVVGPPARLPQREEGERSREYFTRCATDLEARWRALGAK